MENNSFNIKPCPECILDYQEFFFLPTGTKEYIAARERLESCKRRCFMYFSASNVSLSKDGFFVTDESMRKYK